MRRRAGLLILAGMLLTGCAADDTSPEPVVEEEARDAAAERVERWRGFAEGGDAIAQRLLGLAYYLGRGVDKDYEQAFLWLERAASRGDGIAQITVGKMYASGLGVSPDDVQAYLWFSLAAEQGEPGGERRVERLTQSMTEDELAEARRLFHDWMPVF